MNNPPCRQLGIEFSKFALTDCRAVVAAISRAEGVGHDPSCRWPYEGFRADQARYGSWMMPETGQAHA
jgi:hypothetical protein